MEFLQSLNQCVSTHLILQYNTALVVNGLLHYHLPNVREDSVDKDQ